MPRDPRRTRVTLSWNPAPAVKRHPVATVALTAVVALGSALLRGCPELGLELREESAQPAQAVD